MNENFEDSDLPDGEAADREMPTVPADIRLAARHVPDHWLAVTDLQWRGDGPPPSWAVICRWRTGPDGEITHWEANPGHRPSPETLGWPEPTDPIDAAIQRAVTGYGHMEAVVEALTGAEIAVPTDPHGAPLVAAAPDGTPVVPVFSSAGQLGGHAGLAYRVLLVEELSGVLSDCRHVLFNPGAAAPCCSPSTSCRSRGRADLNRSEVSRTPHRAGHGTPRRRACRQRGRKAPVAVA
ncbi:type VII secretion system-associated protein [Streptomyces mirabilis]|uniref:type VII secretion system-associated protein n=1 Tax=Streptomyces mirabilis TaxID=68239 RepID=UPI0033276D82